MKTTNYFSEFDVFLVFDGNLTMTSAYDAALLLACDTTFDASGSLTCVWMDQHYNWNDAAFKNRSGELLNLAVNLVADMLHSFYGEAVIPEFLSWIVLPLLLSATLTAIIARRRFLAGRRK